MKIAYVIRPHPTKNKPLVTPCKSLPTVYQLMTKLRQQGLAPTVSFSRKNIASGEDCYV